MRPRRLRFVSLLLLVVLVAAACGDDDDSTSGSPASTTEAAEPAGPDDSTGVTDTSIKIGMHSSVTGSLPGFHDGALARMQRANDEGGVFGRKIDLEVETEGYLDPVRASGAARKAVDQEKVFMMMGVLGGDAIAAVTKVVDERQVPYVHGGGDEASIADSDYSFAVTPTHPYLAERTADYIVENLDGKNKKIGYALLASPEYDGSAKRFEDTIEEATGTKPVGVRIRLGERNVAPFMLQLKNAGVEVLYTILTSEGILLANEGKAQGFTPTYVMNTACLSLLVTASQGAFDGAHCQQVSESLDSTSPGVTKARADWQKYGGGKPFTEQVLWGYSVADIVLAALQETGESLTRESFLETLEDFTYANQITGRVEFDGSQMGGNHEVATWRVSATKITQVEGLH